MPAASSGHQFFALGRTARPGQITVDGKTYCHALTFKHDFFAFTARYDRCSIQSDITADGPPSVVLKFNRTGDFLGLPLDWIGRHLQNNECQILERLAGIGGTPRLLGRFGSTGLIYEYIDGHSLDQTHDLPAGYFHELEILLKKVHARNIAYVDLNKRGNILLGADGHPWLIDFQISTWIDWPWPFKNLGLKLLGRLQFEDFYHLNKHKRKFFRKNKPKEQTLPATPPSRLIQIHRSLFRPLTLLRRQLLGVLHDAGFFPPDPTIQITPETDPDRFHRYGQC